MAQLQSYQLKEISKACTSMGRHNQRLLQSGIMDAEGWISFEAMLPHIPHVHSEAALIAVLRSKNLEERSGVAQVRHSWERRFHSNHGMVMCYRAVQGHSLRGLNFGTIMEEVEFPPCLLVHGTFLVNVGSIIQHGLDHGRSQQSATSSRNTRVHHHFVPPSSMNGPTPGLRMGSDVEIILATNRARRAGAVFYKTDNNCFLTEGVRGVVPSAWMYLIRRRDGMIIWENKDAAVARCPWDGTSFKANDPLSDYLTLSMGAWIFKLEPPLEASGWSYGELVESGEVGWFPPTFAERPTAVLHAD